MTIILPIVSKGMYIDIHAEQDENFKITSVKVGDEVFKPDILTIEEVEVVVPEIVPEPQVAQPPSGPRPVPLENHRVTNSFNLFEGTSWGDK